MYTGVTKREILFSIIIVMVMLVIGIVIHENISESLAERQQMYNNAVQINDNQELMNYGMKTDVGNAFVYSKLKALDTVTLPELDSEYMYIKKVKERYTMHTRTVTKTRSDGTTYQTTETYWSWDFVSSDEIKTQNVSFCNITFPINKIDIPNAKYIKTINESSNIRYIYYVVEPEYMGTLFTELKEGTISEDSSFYESCTISEVIERLNSGSELYLFWFLWTIGIVFAVVVFCYFENKWLR